MLEIGTGHGSLTLHLARAIHAANAYLPPPDQAKQCPEDQEAQHPIDISEDPRPFILHTLDSDPKRLAYAKKVIHGFRAGLYTRNISFHSGTLPTFLQAQYTHRSIDPNIPNPFLSYVIIDIPGAHDLLAEIAPAMHRNATLAVYCPNITQLVRCERLIKKTGLPFWMERAVELGSGISGGREWMVRHPRRPGEKWRSSEEQRTASNEGRSSTGANGGSLTDGADAGWLARAQAAVAQLVGGTGRGSRGEGQRSDSSGPKEPSSPRTDQDDDDYRIVCRPKAGYIVPVSGFLGIWRRMPW